MGKEAFHAKEARNAFPGKTPQNNFPHKTIISVEYMYHILFIHLSADTWVVYIFWQL